MNDIPQNELDIVVEAIRSHPEYLEPEYVINIYKSCCFNVIADPFSKDVLIPIKRALQEKIPLSVIRIGDGEANLMTYGVYANTSNLDHYAVKAIMAMQEDSFVIDESWMIVLRDLMMGAIAQADVVGVIGLWRPSRPTTEKIIERFLQDYRGLSGHWRAIDYMLYLANKGWFNDKIIASAHLYFSILEHLDIILPLARKIFILSSRENIVEKLQQKYTDLDFEYIAVGNITDSLNIPSNKYMFSHVFSTLPQDMSEYLCLVGAGPWAEIYCTWIKQRGGVGIDIGSGCDLLDGKISRPVHKTVSLEKVQKYKL